MNDDIKVVIGVDSDGYIYEDVEKVRSCNICEHFKGYGLHWVSGYCSAKNLKINGGYTGNYVKTAKVCDMFEPKEELVIHF